MLGGKKIVKNKWDGICKSAEHKLIVTTKQMRWIYLLPHQCVNTCECMGLQNWKVLEKLSSPPSHLMRPVFMKQQISALNSITHYHHNFCTWATYLYLLCSVKTWKSPLLWSRYFKPLSQLSSFYSCEKWGLEMLSNLSKVTQLVNGIQPNSVWIWSPCSFLHYFTTLKNVFIFFKSRPPFLYNFCYGLNDAVPKFVCWSFNLQYDSIWGWAFRR